MRLPACRPALAAVLLVAALALLPARAEIATVPPPDPAAISPQVRRAVAGFERIVAARDLAALEAHIADEAKMSFGGGTLREVWQTERDGGAALWRELAEILRLGGVETRIDDGGVEWSAPYPAFSGEGTYDDPFQALIVTGSRVALRLSPSPRARIVARVDHAVLVADCDGTDTWACVRWEGRPVYVHDSLVRSPIDHRLSMKVDGEDWKIAYFVAGD